MAIDVNKKFGKFFSGTNWSHEEFYGVGVEFIGFPNDVERFTELLLNQSCNPIATQRIIRELEINMDVIIEKKQ